MKINQRSLCIHNNISDAGTTDVGTIFINGRDERHHIPFLRYLHRPK